MDDRHQTEGQGRRGPAMLLVYADNHAVAEAVAEGLRAAGCETVRAESVYAAVVALAAEPARFAAALLAIDFFNREELRFFPMVKRRWPDLPTVALAAPAFAYKAAIADLAGADFVCTEAARAGELIERLVTTIQGLAPRTETATPSPYPLPSRERGEEETTKATETAFPSSAGGFNGNGRNSNTGDPWVAPTKEKDEVGGERKRRGPRQAEGTEAAVVRLPLSELPQNPAAPPPMQDILTEEELAALMENMEEDDLPNE
jgi:CheY-like chemotaxis protein